MKIVEYNSTYVPKLARTEYYNYGGNNLSSVVNSQYDTVSRPSLKSILYGDNYPNWKQLLADHRGAVTELSVIESSITEISVGRYSGHSPRLMAGTPNSEKCKCILSGTLTKVISNPMVPNYKDLVFADNLAKTKYLKDINQQYRALSGFVLLGELSETIRLILRPGRAIVQLTERLRRDALSLRRRRKSTPVRPSATSTALKRATSFSDLWLQYTFGLIPLLSDIDDGARALSRIMNPGDLPQFVKVRGQSQTSNSSSTLGSSQSANLFMFLKQKKVTDMSAGVRYYGELDRLYAGLNSAYSQLGVDFLSIVPAAWELVPWSFLIDYFTNIGDLIEAVTIPQVGMRWNAMGYIYTNDVTYSSQFAGMSGAYPGDWTGEALSESVVRARGRILKRVPNVGYVLPTFEAPSLSGLSSKWRRQANILALAVTTLGRR